MVSLRSGKKVPFLGKNIPKRPYSYKKPIHTAEENELTSKIGSISIHEPSSAPEDTKSEMDGADVNINNLIHTYGSMPSLEGSKAEEFENFDTTDDETNVKSKIEIDTAELPNEPVGIITKFEAKMGKAATQSYSPLIRAIPTFLDSSHASSQDSTLSESSQDLTEDSVLISDVSSIDAEFNRFDEDNEKYQQNLFSDISSASLLSSTLLTMADKAIGSDSSSDEED